MVSTSLSFSQFLVPGFVDAHIHAPQYLYTGTGYDLELLQWLDNYTYPTESRYGDVAFAQDVYSKAVVRSGEVRGEGGEVRVKGGEVRVTGSEVRVKGGEVRVTGGEVRVTLRFVWDNLRFVWSICCVPEPIWRFLLGS